MAPLALHDVVLHRLEALSTAVAASCAAFAASSEALDTPLRRFTLATSFFTADGSRSTAISFRRVGDADRAA